MKEIILALLLTMGFLAIGCDDDDDDNDSSQNNAGLIINDDDDAVDDDDNNDVDDDDNDDSDTPVPPAVRCEGGKDALFEGYYTPNSQSNNTAGIEYCPNESVHRYEAKTCEFFDYEIEESLSDASNCPDGCIEDGISGVCFDDGWVRIYECVYKCESDGDCPKGRYCLCTNTETDFNFSECVKGNCSTDEDCEVGFQCGVTKSECGASNGLYCHTPNDDCYGDVDCEDMYRCAFDENEAKWTCMGVALCE